MLLKFSECCLLWLRQFCRSVDPRCHLLMLCIYVVYHVYVATFRSPKDILGLEGTDLKINVNGHCILRYPRIWFLAVLRLSCSFVYISGLTLALFS